jgi:hypothetical protein
MAISEPDAGKVIATPAIGAGSDGAAFDAGTGYAFSSNGDGTMTVVAQTGGKWDVLENIATERGARTIAVDEKTHKVYSPTAKTAPSQGGGRATFYFASEARVDFRELVRDLAAKHRTRIEMRQVGVRDEAKMVGGIGSCGRELCCSTFLPRFAPVSIKMAKHQNLVLNPTKVSGQCGRLKCCLVYEEANYVEAAKALLPWSATTQYLGNSPTPNNVNRAPLRFARRRQDVSRVGRPASGHHRRHLLADAAAQAEAAEAAALARVEWRSADWSSPSRATTTRWSPPSGCATAQLAAQQSARFQIAQQQERLGQVARSDVVKAEISDRQMQQGYRDATLAMGNARLTLAVLLSATLDENFTVVDDLHAAPPLPPFNEVRSMAGRDNPDLRAADESLKAAAADVTIARNAFYPTLAVEAVYGIEANEFALHSRVAAQPELGVLPNLGYFLTVNLSVPIWDWGGMRSKLHQSEARRHLAEVTLSQTQRQLLGNLYTMYNEALAARAGVENLQRVAELAAESLRLTGLRYQAGESTALEVVDAGQSRNAADDAETKLRVALAGSRPSRVASDRETPHPDRRRDPRGGAALRLPRQKEEETAPVVAVDVASALAGIQRTIRADGLLYPRQRTAIVPKISAPVKLCAARRASSGNSSSTRATWARPRRAASAELAKRPTRRPRGRPSRRSSVAELDARAARTRSTRNRPSSPTANSCTRRRDRAEGRRRGAGESGKARAT